MDLEYRNAHAPQLEFRIRDKSAGIVEARTNQLEVIDDYDSVFADGFWDGVVHRSGKLPKILVDHEGRRAGRVTETRQVRSRDGLFQHSVLQYNLRSPYGAEAFEDIADGTDDEFSHGFVTAKQHYEKRDGLTVTVKDECRMWPEISQVLAGASPGTGTLSVRSALDSLDLPDFAELLDYRAVAVKGGAPKSPPAGYPEDSSKYGDPTNYKYPLDTDARIHAAVAYFNHSGQQEAGGYSSEEWASVGRRIVAAANKAFGGGYSYAGGKVETGSRAAIVEETRVGTAISASNRSTLQKAHDALVSLPGVHCLQDKVSPQEDEPDPESMAQPKSLQEYRELATALGIEAKG